MDESPTNDGEVTDMTSESAAASESADQPEKAQLPDGMQVTDNVAASRYELEVDGALVGIASYQLVDGAAVIHHTEISPRRQGNGLGAVLVGAALDDLRGRGLGVVPRCWYVGQFIDENPAYADMLSGAG